MTEPNDRTDPNDGDEARPTGPSTPSDPIEPSRPAEPSAADGASASGSGPAGGDRGESGEPGETSAEPPPTAMPGESAGDKGASSEGDWWVRGGATGGARTWMRQRGQRIAGYELVDRIDKDANNAFGEVWLARRLEPFQRVAIKFLRPDRVREDLVKRFKGEAKALARFNHPYIARFFELGLDRESPYLVMQYVPGSRITGYCDARGLSIEKRLEMMSKVCDAVQHVHLQGLVHRDLKPDNILVSETGPGERSPDDAEAGSGPIPVLIDFGLAKSTNPDNPLTSNMPDGVGRGLFGTYSYASPEQIRANREEDTGREADVYALGAVLFELLAGVSPMQHVLEDESLSAQERAMRLAHDDRPTLLWAFDRLDPKRRASIAAARGTTEAGLRRALRSRLRHLTEHALRSDPRARFSDARAMGRDIENHLADRDFLEAAAEPAASRLLRHVRRHRLPYAAAIMVLVALVGGFVTTSWQWRVAVRQRDLSEAVIRFIAEDVLEPEGIELDQNVRLAEVLDGGAASVEDETIERRPEVQARLQQILGRAQLAIGRPAEARSLLQNSLDLHEANSEIGTVESRIELLQDLADAIRQCGHEGGAAQSGEQPEDAPALLDKSRALIESQPVVDPRLAARQALFEGNLRKAEERFDEAEVLYGSAVEIVQRELPGETIGILAVFNRCLVEVERAKMETDPRTKRERLERAEACFVAILGDEEVMEALGRRAAPGRIHPLETLLLIERARAGLRIDLVDADLRVEPDSRRTRLEEIAKLFESGGLRSQFYANSWRARELLFDEGTLRLRQHLAAEDDRTRRDMLARGLGLYLDAHGEYSDLSEYRAELRHRMASYLASDRSQSPSSVPPPAWKIADGTTPVEMPLEEAMPHRMAAPMSSDGPVGVLVLPEDDIDLDLSVHLSDVERVADRGDAGYAFLLLDKSNGDLELQVEAKGTSRQGRKVRFWMVVVHPPQRSSP